MAVINLTARFGTEFLYLPNPGMEMMTPKKLGTAILCSALLAASSLYGQASDNAASPTKDDVATLKQQLAEQQREIDALKAAVEAQNKLMQRTANAAPAGSIAPGTTTAHTAPDTFSLPSKSLGDVAST